MSSKRMSLFSDKELQDMFFDEVEEIEEDEVGALVRELVEEVNEDETKPRIERKAVRYKIFEDTSTIDLLEIDYDMILGDGILRNFKFKDKEYEFDNFRGMVLSELKARGEIARILQVDGWTLDRHLKEPNKWVCHRGTNNFYADAKRFKLKGILPQFSEELETLEDLYILVESEGREIKSIRVISLSGRFNEEIELSKAKEISNSIIL